MVVNAALVDDHFSSPEIEISYAGLMSAVRGSFATQEMADHHLEQGLQVQRIERTYTINVQALTLTAILDRFTFSQEIDLLSLDVEGYEANALRGLNFDKYRPRYLCIEVRDKGAIDDLLAGHYREVEVLFACDTYRDVLYERIGQA